MGGQQEQVLQLFGELTIRTIQDAAEQMRRHLAVADDAVLDLGQVTEADVSLVQLILSARKSALASGKQLRLAAPAGGAVLACLRAGGFLPERPCELRTQNDFWLNQGEE